MGVSLAPSFVRASLLPFFDLRVWYGVGQGGKDLVHVCIDLVLTLHERSNDLYRL